MSKENGKTTVRLKWLKLENFKGINDFTLDLTGRDYIKVVGENGTGKTTLFDGFTWLLWGEDSKGQSRFDVKPLDNDGNPKDVETKVTGILEIDGEEIELEKDYEDSREYLVDGEPVKKKEYDNRIRELVDLDTLRFLVDPLYFNTLHWEDRREKLLEIIDGVNPEEVISQDPDLEDLDLKGKDPKGRKKEIKKKKKELKEEKASIPAKIDELTRSMTESGESEQELKEKIGELEERKEELEEKIADLKSSGEEAELREEKQEAREELEDFKNYWKENRRDKIDIIREEMETQKDVESELADETAQLITKKTKKERKVEDLEKEMEELREEFRELAESGKTCPTCGQDFPPEKLGENKKKIREKGRTKKDEKEDLEQEIEAQEEQLRKNQLALEGVEEFVQKKSREIEQLKDNLDRYKEVREYQEKIGRYYSVEKKLESGDFDRPESLEKLENELKETRNRLKGANKALNKVEERKRTQTRIEELKSKETELSTRKEELERQMMLLEKFVEIKVGLVEEEVNEKFDFVDWKLFREYKTKDTVSPWCAMTVKGVSADSTLNHGALIKGGLDIIGTLSDHYGVKAPVWIDQSESITELPDPGTQLIELQVRENVEVLEVVNSD